MAAVKYKYWNTVNLNIDIHSDVSIVANFLQNEFCPEGADTMWSAEYFRWKLGVENPGGSGILTYALHNNEIVGVASLTKKRVLIDGVECIAAEVGDTYTLANMMRRGKPKVLSKIDQNPSSYINKSIFGRLISDITNQATKDGVSFIYGTPNKNSYPGYTKKLDYLVMEKYQNTRYIRPTARLLVRTYKFFKPFEQIIKFIELSVIEIQNYIYKSVLHKGCKFSERVPSQDEINDLWLRVKPASGFSLVRDYIYWKHRYLDHPIASYDFFTIYKDGRLKAMAVTRRFTSRKNNSTIAIVEWMMEDSDYFSYILSSVLKHFKKLDVNYFYFWSEAVGRGSLSALHNLFIFKSKVPIIFSDTLEARSFLANEAPMEFYLGSSDAI